MSIRRKGLTGKDSPEKWATRLLRGDYKDNDLRLFGDAAKNAFYAPGPSEIEFFCESIPGMADVCDKIRKLDPEFYEYASQNLTLYEFIIQVFDHFKFHRPVNLDKDKRHFNYAVNKREVYTTEKIMEALNRRLDSRIRSLGLE